MIKPALARRVAIIFFKKPGSIPAGSIEQSNVISTPLPEGLNVVLVQILFAITFEPILSVMDSAIASLPYEECITHLVPSSFSQS